MQKLLPIGKAAGLLGVSVDTIRNWDRAGKIHVERTPGGERRIPFEEIKRLAASLPNKFAKDEINNTYRSLNPNKQIGILTTPPHLANPQLIPASLTTNQHPNIEYTSKVFVLTTIITLLLLFTANNLPGTKELIEKHTLRNSEVTSSISNVVVPEKPAPPIITASVGSITGTSGRITVLGTDDLIVNIATTYSGQKSISTLGTITTGIWNGTVLTNTFISNTLTIDSTGSVNAGAVNSGTLGTAGVTLRLGSFGSITGSLADTNVSDTLTVGAAGSVNAGAIDAGTLGTAGLTLGLSSFGTTTGALADANVSNNLTIDSTGSVDWTALNSYPTSCSDTEFIRSIGDSLTCATDTSGSAVATVVVGTSNPAGSSNNYAQADFVCGATDCDGTIETAIASLPTGGGVVYLLEGTYVIDSDGIDITNDDVSIIGSGYPTILQRGADAFPMIRVGDGSGSTPVRGVVIKNLQIDGVQATYTSNTNSAIEFWEDVTQSQISNTWLHDNDGGGIIFDSDFGDEVSNNTISGNQIISNNWYGIQLDNRSHYNLITENNVQSNGAATPGIYIFISANNRITDNNVESNSCEGIVLHLSSNNNVVSGNNISSNGTSCSSGEGIRVSTSSNNVISGNFITDVGGSSGSDPGILISTADNNLIVSNVMFDSDGTSPGITISTNSDDNYIIGNEISGAGFTSEINDAGTGTTIQHRDQFEVETALTSGNIFNLDWTGTTTATESITGFNLDFTNLTADGTNPVYALSINDPAGTTGSTEYGIYQQGTNWDYGAYFEDDVYFDTGVDIEGQFSVGTQVTLSVDDATPDVSTASTFITANTVPTTITDFDAGAGSLENGHIIFIEIGDGSTTIDCDGGNINCGTTDIVVALGDFATFFYDGTDWNLVSLMDDSQDQGAGSGFDIAEWFPASEELEPGNVVSIDPESSTLNSLMKSGKEYDSKLIGIVSAEPGLTLGKPAEGFAYPIALTGRVPIKISTENGLIIPGDPLTSSSTPGVAMKATNSGPIVGKALESYSEAGIGKIITFVSVGWYVEPIGESSAPLLALGGLPISLDEFGSIQIDGNLIVRGDINLTGDLTLDGTVTANEIVTKNLKILASDEPTAGNSTIKAGELNVIVPASSLTSGSKVFVTPTTLTGGQPLIVIDKKPGEYFLVEVAIPYSKDIQFDWWVVN